MSSIIIIHQSDAVHLVTDAASYDRDGTLMRVASKVRHLPESGCAFTIRGTSYAFDPMELLLGALPTFDAIMKALPGAIEIVLRTMQADATPFITIDSLMRNFEITVAGWSDQRQEWCAGVACTHPVADPTDPVGLSHLDGYQPFVPMLAAPMACMPPVDMSAVLERDLSNKQAVDAVDAAFDGLKLIEAQRLVPCIFDCQGDGVQYVVGGFAELTTVSAAGVSTTILREWPDEVGKLIEPEGAEPIASVEARLAASNQVAQCDELSGQRLAA